MLFPDSFTALHDEMRHCERCHEAGHPITPGAIFTDGPRARVLLIGQAPGVTEVTAKRMFNAGSGRRLFQWLGEAGWDETDFRARYYMTAVTKCYPGRNRSGRGDRVPGKAEQKICRSFLEREIRLVRPNLMILVGGLAIKLLYPAKMKLTEVVGTAVYFPAVTLGDPLNFNFQQGVLRTEFAGELEDSGRYVVPLPHPSGASLWPNDPANAVLISRAIKLLGKIKDHWDL